MSMNGRISLVTGNGKGKTTTALGYALRTLSQGGRVTMIQFLKGGGYSGELFTEGFFDGRFVIRQFGAGCPISDAIRDGKALCNKCGACFRGNRDPTRKFASEAWQFFLQSAVRDNPPELIILDELAHAVRRGLLPENEVVEQLNSLPDNVRIIMTGRNAPASLAALADETVECQAVKHPMERGIAARWGIEY